MPTSRKNSRKRRSSKRSNESVATSEQQVDAFLSILQKRYGLTEEEIAALPKTIHFMVAYRKQLDTWAGWFMKSFIAMIAVGIGMAFWEGVKQVITRNQ